MKPKDIGMRRRLAAMRPVWPSSRGFPRYEMLRMFTLGLRADVRLEERILESLVERDRRRRRDFPGRLGEWPDWRPDVRRRKRS
jgi:hypothetical protein